MRRPFTALAATVLVAGVFAGTAGGCAFDWGFPSEATPDGADETSADTSSLPDVSKEANTVETSPPPPPPKDCKLPEECGAGSYCRFADHQCGAGKPGVCTLIDASCAQVAWVCGCKGTAYKNVCEAAKSLEDVGATGPCSAPPTPPLFRCGTRLCDVDTTFCVTNKSGPVAEYDCVSFVGCGAGNNCSCATVKDLACSSCNDVKVGAVVVTCP